MDAKLSCLIKGLIGVVFGSVAILVPDLTLTTFLAVFWVLVAAGVLVCIFLAITSPGEESLFWFIFATGFLVMGVVSFIFTWVVAILFLLAVAALAFYSGYSGISLALAKPKTKYFLIGGTFVVGILFLIFMFRYVPAMTGNPILLVIGIFALVFGVLSILMGWSISDPDQKAPELPIIKVNTCKLFNRKEP
ncbi:MAG: hypothetical protein ABFC71_11420 [Methanoregula sp.]